MGRFGLSKRIMRCRIQCRSLREESTTVVLERSKPVHAVEICEVAFDADVSTPHRVYFLSQAELICEMCGIAPGDIDDLTEERAKFHIGHIIDKSLGGKDELSNLRALCSTCNQGAKNITPVKPPAIWLLSQIRRAGQEEQRAVLDWLLKKFKE